MQWFRFYKEALHDPKVQTLEPELFKFWVNILCLACEHDGYLPSEEDISFAFRVTIDSVTWHLHELKTIGLLDKKKRGLTPHGWSRRQYKSDDSKERVRRYRDRHRNGDVTVTVTPPEQIQNRTDTEQKKPPIVPHISHADPISHVDVLKAENEARRADLNETHRGILEESQKLSKEIKRGKALVRSFDHFWDIYPRHTKKQEALKAWTKLNPDAGLQQEIETAVISQKLSFQWNKNNGEFIPHPSSWLNGHRWTDELPADHGTTHEQRELKADRLIREQNEETAKAFAFLHQSTGHGPRGEDESRTIPVVRPRLKGSE